MNKLFLNKLILYPHLFHYLKQNALNLTEKHKGSNSASNSLVKNLIIQLNKKKEVYTSFFMYFFILLTQSGSYFAKHYQILKSLL
jgi:hypothetical protein